MWPKCRPRAEQPEFRCYRLPMTHWERTKHAWLHHECAAIGCHRRQSGSQYVVAKQPHSAYAEHVVAMPSNALLGPIGDRPNTVSEASHERTTP